MYLVTSIPIVPPPWKKKIFSVVTQFLQQFLLSLFPLVFGVIFFPSCSCLPCPLKYMVSCMSPLNTCAAWHTVYYQVMYQENNSVKKTLFIVFGLKLRILLHFPVGGSAYLFPNFVLGIWRVGWHIVVLPYGILLALSIKDKGVF